MSYKLSLFLFLTLFLSAASSATGTNPVPAPLVAMPREVGDQSQSVSARYPEDMSQYPIYSPFRNLLNQHSSALNQVLIDERSKRQEKLTGKIYTFYGFKQDRESAEYVVHQDIIIGFAFVDLFNMTYQADQPYISSALSLPDVSAEYVPFLNVPARVTLKFYAIEHHGYKELYAFLEDRPSQSRFLVTHAFYPLEIESRIKPQMIKNLQYLLGFNFNLLNPVNPNN